MIDQRLTEVEAPLRDMLMYTLRLTKKALETIGTSSIEGLLFENGIPYQSRVKIEFEEFSLGQCKENDGPDLVIIPEYVIRCVCESLLNLAASGYTVEVGNWHK